MISELVTAENWHFSLYHPIKKTFSQPQMTQITLQPFRGNLDQAIDWGNVILFPKETWIWAKTRFREVVHIKFIL